MSPSTIAENASTIDKAKVRRCVILYLSQRLAKNEDNLVNLQKILCAKDPQSTGIISNEEFEKALEQVNYTLIKEEKAELMKELDPEEKN